MNEDSLLVSLAERNILLSCQDGHLENRAPQGAIDSDILAGIAEHREHLCRALEGRSGFFQLAPASYNQISLFFIHALNPTSSAYTLPLSMHLHADVDAQRMRLALGCLTERHSALRATFSQISFGQETVVCQLIAETLTPVLDEFDAHADSAEELFQRARAYHSQPMDIERGPLLRAALFRCGSAGSVLIVDMHHVTVDGWSFNIVLRDLARYYRESTSGHGATDEPPVPDHFRACLEQQRFLATPEAEAQIAFWQNVHTPLAAGLSFGPHVDARRRPVRRPVGATEYFELDAERRERLAKFARVHRVTPFTVLLAVFEAFLLQRSRQNEVVVGIPTLGHRTSEFMDTVGYFVNPIALRSRRPQALTFREHLECTARELKEALRNRDAPLAAVVERLGGARDPSRTPVFQVVFNHLARRTLGEVADLAYPCSVGATVDFGGITATAYPLHAQEGQFDLTVEFVERGQILLGILKYSTDLFTPNEALEMVAELRRLIDATLVEPDVVRVGPSVSLGGAAPPPAAALLDWTQPAAELETLVDRYAPGGASLLPAVAKLLLPNGLLLCGAAERVDTAGNAVPGTILELGPSRVLVATGDGVLALSKLLDLAGRPLAWEEVVSNCGLTVGQQLPVLEESARQAVFSLAELATPHESFWVERLRDPAVPSLPYLVSAASARTDGEVLRTLSLPISRERLALLADAFPGWTPADFLGIVFALYLSQLCPGEPLALGVCPSNLAARVCGWESLFSDRVPMRVQIEDSWTVVQACESLRDQLRELEEHSTFPTDLSARHVGLGELNLRRVLPAHLVWGASDAGSLQSHPALTLVIPEQDPPYVTYSPEMLTSGDAERMVDQYLTFLDSSLAEPSRPVREVSLLSASERKRVLQDWNDTAIQYPGDMLLHHYIEAQAAATPEAPAVRFGDATLTYRELDRRANSLAVELLSLGLGPGCLVALYMERSIELMVALVAVLKAGAAYVPLEPSYPQDRIAFMLQDIQAKVVLTQSSLRARLPASDATVMCLDASVGHPGSDGSPESTVTPEHAAYLIYTSGSTGKPKGVLNSHRGICNRLLWMQQEYRLTEHDRVMQKTPYGFDVSVWELFWPLMFGACLVVARPEGHKDPSYLVDLIRNEAVTVLHFVPSMLRLFLDQQGLDRCSSLKRVICSGEALPYELQERFFERCSAELHNLYGPTEAAVDVTYWKCRRGDDRHIVPIGRPVANTQTYILDRRGRPTPVGVPGELHLGGVQIALGYLNRPELTRERFVADPFRDDPAARLYRTGDLCRYLDDGAIEFLGRIDFQVKIRGFRIELGEIESALITCPGVREAAVVARTDERDTTRKYLAAYLVTDGSHPPSSQIRAILGQSLPDYMVPDVFVVLDRLPLSSNGKLDRRALPDPPRTVERAGVRGPLAATDLERQLAAIFCQILGLQEVGVEENFFDMGGDSLRASRVVDAIRQSLAPELELVRLFEHPTIRALAAFLGGSTQDQSMLGAQARAARQKQAIHHRKRPGTG